MATAPEGGIAFDVVTYLTDSLAEDRGWHITERGASNAGGVLVLHLICEDASTPIFRPKRLPVRIEAGSIPDLLAKVVALDPTEAAPAEAVTLRYAQALPPSQPVVLWPDGIYRLLRAEHLRDPHRDAVVAGVTVGWLQHSARAMYPGRWETGARLAAYAAHLPLPGPEADNPADLAIRLVAWAIEGDDARPPWVDKDYSIKGGA